MDYMFNAKTTLTGAFLYNIGKGDNVSNILYSEYDYNDQLTGSKTRTFMEEEIEPNMDYNITFRKEFAKKDQLLTLIWIIPTDMRKELADIDEQLVSEEIPPNDPLLIQQSEIVETNDNFVIQADYAHPVFEQGRWEVGLKSSIRNINNDYTVEEQEDGDWVALPGLTNQFDYDEDIYAVYSTLGNKTGKISYQVGIRFEGTRMTRIW